MPKFKQPLKHLRRVLYLTTVFVLVVFLGYAHRREKLYLGNICMGTGNKHVATSVDSSPPANVDKFYAVSLAGVKGALRENESRLQEFFREFNEVCRANPPNVKVVAGYTDRRRGAGLTKSFVEILEDATLSGVDRAFIFEDDVQFLNGLFCSSVFRDNLWKQAPQSFVLMFAAHHVESRDRLLQTSHFHFERLVQAQGSYAWSIQRAQFSTLKQFWEAQLADLELSNLSPDLDISRGSSQLASHVVRFPPLVWHKSNTYSNTWNEHRTKVADKPMIDLIVFNSNNKASWYISEKVTVLKKLKDFNEKDGVNVNPIFFDEQQLEGNHAGRFAPKDYFSLAKSPLTIIVSSECSTCFADDTLRVFTKNIIAEPYLFHVARKVRTAQEHVLKDDCHGTVMMGGRRFDVSLMNYSTLCPKVLQMHRTEYYNLSSQHCLLLPSHPAISV